LKVHLSAVCGTAMGSLAGLLAERGDTVTGSDQSVYPPMSTQLEKLGVEILTPYAAENVPGDADLVVIGNALSRGNPEVEIVLDRRQAMSSLPQTLSEQFLIGRRSCVIAGTHGKTTTSSLLASLLSAAGRDPSFLIGGVPREFDKSYQLGAGEEFVVEGDEYDCAFFDKRPKFVHYRPDVAVIGNLEFDHADIYADLAAVQLAFRRLLSVIPSRGLLIAGVESAALREVLPEALCRVQTFGVETDADWCVRDVVPDAAGWRFELRQGDMDWGWFQTPMSGRHNIRNAVAALAVAAEVGVSPTEARGALARFAGVKRRLERRGEARGIVVFDDFAHHPTAVRETLAGLRATSSGRIVAIFEPRSYTSRTRTFQNGFAEALAIADLVVVAAAHLPEKVPEQNRLRERELVDAISEQGARAIFLPDVDQIVARLPGELVEGDSVVVLSNGGFGGIHSRLLEALQES